MNRSLSLLAWATAFAGCAVVNAASGEWLSTFPVGQGDAVSKRSDEYVKLSKSPSWGELYDFVCAAALGGVNRQTFISKMTTAHGTEFANSPDLLTFRPSQASILADGEYDIYGCAKAKKEGREYNGIAVPMLSSKEAIGSSPDGASQSSQTCRAKPFTGLDTCPILGNSICIGRPDPMVAIGWAHNVTHRAITRRPELSLRTSPQQ